MNLKQILAKAKNTDNLVIGSGALDECGSLLNSYWDENKVIIVADTNTWKAAGEKLSVSLKSGGFEILPPVIFTVPPFLLADYENVRSITSEIDKHPDSVLVAVGSGTINDLVKRAAFETGKTYMCVGTAASMDGYCSSGAALSSEGRKQTMECPAPRVIIADTDILETAPPESSAAGYGDLASKLTAGADWIIADFTGDDPIDSSVWEIVQPRLEGWLSSPEKLAAAEPEALSRIFEGLNFSGLAMQVLGRSRAASGAEHLFSHIWEMSGHLGADGNPVSHGFQVSIGILCVTALMEEVFSKGAEEINIEKAVDIYPSWPKRAAEIEELMGALPSWEEYLAICRKKHLEKDQLLRKLQRIKGGWEVLSSRVWSRLPSYREMKNSLRTAGCPISPEDINLDRQTAIKTYAKAQCMRNRYTILDLAYEIGILNDCAMGIQSNSEYLYR
ncbi:MAG: sn-glycerol-1-phosphate dehydrogenase [Spirochaetales bacterium]|nr:sn-glycerol-1-phosphate dehydrogenase [Spirochaetales bacterium]